MRQKEIELLQAYFLNYMTILEGEVTQLQNNIRFRRIDTIDCIELIIARERLNCFLEFKNNVYALLNLQNCEVEENE